MKAICNNMSEQEMRAVAAYVEAFPSETGMPTDTPTDGRALHKYG
jgi:cytochrome c553